MTKTRIIGILNITADSFSDGGRYLDPAAALAHARHMRAAGAALIDIGAEPSNIDAAEVSAEDEIARLDPIVRALKADGATISVDTRKPAVMRHVLSLGADIINDITALHAPDAVAALRASGLTEPPSPPQHSVARSAASAAGRGGAKLAQPAASSADRGEAQTAQAAASAADRLDNQTHLPRIILMHARHAPHPPTDARSSAAWRAERLDADPTTIVAEIIAFFQERIATLTAAGIARERLILDPGMGLFLSQKPDASFAVLRELAKLRTLGLPICICTSRKSFIGAALADARGPRPIGDRGAGTLATEIWAALQGVEFIRTHDVRALSDALRILNLLQTA